LRLSFFAKKICKKQQLSQQQQKRFFPAKKNPVEKLQKSPK
jgi:hypothetical protein